MDDLRFELDNLNPIGSEENPKPTNVNVTDEIGSDKSDALFIFDNTFGSDGGNFESAEESSGDEYIKSRMFRRPSCVHPRHPSKCNPVVFNQTCDPSLSNYIMNCNTSEEQSKYCGLKTLYTSSHLGFPMEYRPTCHGKVPPGVCMSFNSSTNINHSLISSNVKIPKAHAYFKIQGIQGLLRMAPEGTSVYLSGKRESKMLKRLEKKIVQMNINGVKTNEIKICNKHLWYCDKKIRNLFQMASKRMQYVGEGAGICQYDKTNDRTKCGTMLYNGESKQSFQMNANKCKESCKPKTSYAFGDDYEDVLDAGERTKEGHMLFSSELGKKGIVGIFCKKIPKEKRWKFMTKCKEMSFEKKTYYKIDSLGNKIKCCFSTFKYKYYIVVKCSAGHVAVKQYKQFFSMEKKVYSSATCEPKLVARNCPSLLDFSKSSYYQCYMKQCAENAKRLAFKFSKGLGCSLQLEKTCSQVNKSHVAQSAYVKPCLERVKYSHDKNLENYLKTSKYNASKNIVYGRPLVLDRENENQSNKYAGKYIKDLYSNDIMEIDPSFGLKKTPDQSPRGVNSQKSGPLVDMSNWDYYGKKQIEPPKEGSIGCSYFYKKFYSPLKGNVNSPPLALPKSIQFTNQLQSVFLPNYTGCAKSHKQFITMNNQTICIDFKKSQKAECLVYISPLQGFCNLKYKSHGYMTEKCSFEKNLGGIYYSGQCSPPLLTHDPRNMFKGIVVPSDLSVKLEPSIKSNSYCDNEYIPGNTYRISSKFSASGKPCADKPWVIDGLSCSKYGKPVCKPTCEPKYEEDVNEFQSKIYKSIYDGDSDSSSEDLAGRGWDSDYQKRSYLKKKKGCEYRKKYNLKKEYCKSMFSEKLENYENCDTSRYLDNGKCDEICSSRPHPIYGYQLKLNSSEYRNLLAPIYTPPSDMLRFEFQNLLGKKMNYQEYSAYNPCHTKPNCMRVIDIPQTMECLKMRTCKRTEKKVDVSYSVFSPVACIQSLPVNYTDVKKYY